MGKHAGKTANFRRPPNSLTPYTAGPMKRIVILISGRGSNMLAIAQACHDERWPARIAAVIANVADAAGLDAARRLGIAAQCVPHAGHARREDFDAALSAAIDAHAPDLVLLAGFMRILGDAFVERYRGRMLNIHPSLLPAFPGLHTHRRAIEAGCRIAGATVHFVTPTLDHGPIVAQAAVPVRPDDNAQSLAARVLQAEHHLYPQAVRWFVHDRLRLAGDRVQQLDGECTGWWASTNG
jgi:phosphoribosylglycinamide formyltransferase 1